MKLPTRMIVERRQDEGKNALRSLVLLVKFLTMSLVSVKHQGCLSSFQLRSRPNARAETRKRKSATRKKGGNERAREDCRIFFSTPLLRYFSSSFPHAQSTITYRTVERSNLFVSNYSLRGLLSAFFILLSSTVLALLYTHMHTIADIHTLSFLSHTLLATTLSRSAGAFCCRPDGCCWVCSSGRSAWLARADAAVAVAAALPYSPLPRRPSRSPE